MAELIAILQEIKQLDPKIHLFCPKQGNDDQTQTQSEQEAKNGQTAPSIDQATSRRKKFISTLELLAYDGKEVEQYQRYILDRLNQTLGNCDACIREYYMGKEELLASFREEYEEEEVQKFSAQIDKNDISRICDGLSNAATVLRALPESQRRAGILQPEHLYAIYEALICEAFLRDQALLQQYFDEPFSMVQTKKPLKIGEYLPAVTRFLFETTKSRIKWAKSVWERIERAPTDVEWHWNMRNILQQKLQSAVTPNELLMLWTGMSNVVDKLDGRQVTHNLFDLVPNFCTTILNHLSRRSSAAPFIVQTVRAILEKAPDAFWQSLGSISASTFVEQVFASPNFNTLLQECASGEESAITQNNEMLSWIPSLLQSLKPANRPPACHTLVSQLFERVQNDHTSIEAKKACFGMAVRVMLDTIMSFSDNEAVRLSVDRVVLSDILNTIRLRIDDVLDPSHLQIGETSREKSRTDVLALIRNALALECICLKADFESLSKDDESPRESSSFTPDIWNIVIRRFDDSDVDLSMAAVRGFMALPGLEQFRAKDMSLLSKEKKSYNAAFDKITGMQSKALERLAEFAPSHLDDLFKTQDTSMSIIAALFSADSSTYEAAVDLVKNVGGLSGRKEALGQLLDAFLDTTVYSICWVFRRISNMKTFASIPRLLKTGMEILDVLCNKEDGILRRRSLQSREAQAIKTYWSYQWMALNTVFRQTEKWSQLHDKSQMTEVCRDAMQYAEALFEEYDLFASALTKAKPESAKDVIKTLLDSSDSSTVASPVKTLESMSKWLRLRDEYLADTLVKLVAKMLARLKSQDVLIANGELAYVQDVATKTVIRTILTESQKAVLVRALEAYYGKKIERDRPKIKKQLTLRDWADPSILDRSGASTPTSRELSIDEFDDSGISDRDLVQAISGKPRDNLNDRSLVKSKDKNIVDLAKPELSRKKPNAIKSLDVRKREQEAKAFIENRKREMAAAKLKQQEIAAKLRGKIGVGEQTKGQGSGLNGIGVKGKDHSSSGPNSMMVSSDSESDSDDSDDEALFGGKVQSIPQSTRAQAGALPARAVPTKKIKQQRSVKDVRARLQPDLSMLHKTILSWDFFAESELPPSSGKDDYTLVTSAFKTVADYQNTFEPLLILEGWQSFRSAREEGNFKPLEVRVSNSLLVDSFVEVNCTIKLLERKDKPGIGVADIVLLSKSKTPDTEPDQPHCLARVKEVSMKKGDLQVVYRMNAAGNSLRPFLNDKSVVFGVQVLSLTPLEREYGALKALQYYDLCEEVIRAKPSPILDYNESQLRDIVQTYEVNLAQAKAVKCAMENDAFTLIQGPPGSGKTKTICALVGAMMSSMQDSSRSRSTNGNRPLPPPAKKVLVCAPSNAAVDELVMRFKAGVKTVNGSVEKLSVVRLGRSDAINANVKDVTLEELVNAKLNLTAPKEKEDINVFMMEHQDTSHKFHALREKISESRARGQPLEPADENTLEGLGRKKKQLGLKIDEMRERQNSAFRDAELNRRRMQQQILDSAHVLCATLSGSGHEIFQGLNVEFETVIIDEAAQSIELSALIPLKYGCSKCILVGDPKQLPPTVLSREAARFQYEQSLFARMEKNHPKDVHLLDTQYRMHPEISLFPSNTFYDGRLKDGAGMAQLRRRPWHHSNLLGPYRFFDVQGMSSAASKGHSLVNYAELNVAMQLYDRLVTDVRQYDFRGKVGIITPYKGQLRALKERFCQRYGSEITSIIEFNTTDAFQGRESEVIIFSCVRASTKGIGFLNDIRRMNVGLTRAKSSLWVLGNSQSLIQGEFWSYLVKDAKTRNLYTDGDIQGLLQRPLLTADMMKDDVEMMDTDADADASSSPSSPSKPSISDLTTDIRRVSSVTQGPSTAQKSSSLTSGSRERPSFPSRSTSFASPDLTSSSTAKSRPSVSKDPPTVEAQEAVRHKSVASIQTRQPSRPELAHRASNETSGSGEYGPSGGRHGLNDKAVCQICGSNAHFSHHCDNEAARGASLGNCSRCQDPGHTQSTCKASRCLECGAVGHLSEDCPVPLNRRLSTKDKEDVRKQEKAWGRRRDLAKEKRAERQLGDHVAKIPLVKTTLPPGPTLNGQGGDGKRKRSDITVLNDEKSAKAIKVSDGGKGTGPGFGVRNMPNDGSVRGPGKPAPAAPAVIKKKRPKDDDMFMRRK